MPPNLVSRCHRQERLHRTESTKHSTSNETSAPSRPMISANNSIEAFVEAPVSIDSPVNVDMDPVFPSPSESRIFDTNTEYHLPAPPNLFAEGDSIDDSAKATPCPVSARHPQPLQRSTNVQVPFSGAGSALRDWLSNVGSDKENIDPDQTPRTMLAGRKSQKKSSKDVSRIPVSSVERRERWRLTMDRVNDGLNASTALLENVRARIGVQKAMAQGGTFRLKTSSKQDETGEHQPKMSNRVTTAMLMVAHVFLGLLVLYAFWCYSNADNFAYIRQRRRVKLGLE